MKGCTYRTDFSSRDTAGWAGRTLCCWVVVVGVAEGLVVAGAATAGGVLPLAGDEAGLVRIAADSRCCT
jgi:predicted ATP-dependent Lon-type protease